MDNDIEVALRGTLRAVIRQASVAELPTALNDLGWTELVQDTPSAFALLYDELGQAARSSRLIDLLALTGLQPAVAANAVLYPVPSRHPQPPAELHGDDVHIDGWALATPPAGTRLVTALLPSLGHVETTLATMPVQTSEALQVCHLDTLEVDGGWVRIAGTVPRSALDITPDPAGRGWRKALMAARLGAATELAGLGRGAIALAVTHVTERTQFGKPIGSFQAVRHRLAEAYAVLAAADALIDEAWSVRTAATIDLAFAYAGQAHREIGAHCLQVSGAMGLTWENNLHRFLRRGYTLDTFFGPSDAMIGGIGADLIGGSCDRRRMVAGT